MESSGSRGAGAGAGAGAGGGGGGGGGDRRGRGGPRTPERCGEDEEDMRSHHLAVLGLLACAAPARAPVRPGIEVLLADSLALVAHRRVGLLTNQTGVARAALAALDGVDVLVVDLQDIGARYYTYAATAAWLMRAAARRHKPVVVLDRPDPLGGLLVQGNVAPAPPPADSGPPAFLPVPMRPGMTIGELLRFANDALGIGARLTVVPAAGWRRAMFYDETGLPWVRPSPNMPD